MFFKFIKQENGQAMAIFAVGFIALMGFTGFALDLGSHYLEKARMQNAADAAVLASVVELPDITAATAKADQYMTLNGGYQSSDYIVTCSLSDMKVSVDCVKEKSNRFMRIFNIDTSTVAVHSAASLKQSPVFDYAIFQGSKTELLQLKPEIEVYGSVHSNNMVDLEGEFTLITGNLEAASTDTIVTKTSYTIGSVVTGAPVYEMPDISDSLSEAQYIDAGGGTWVYDGRSISGNIYVNGNVLIEGNGFTGVGCIYATGDITFNGSSVSIPSGSSVALYTQNGNITLNGEGGNICGTMYAPNGTITINGQGTTIYGRLIANVVTPEGRDLTVITGGEDLLGILPDRPALVE